MTRSLQKFISKDYECFRYLISYQHGIFHNDYVVSVDVAMLVDEAELRPRHFWVYVRLL